jgi:hypothetical protein
MHKAAFTAAIFTAAAAAPVVAHAQPAPTQDRIAFIEAKGGYGLQLGLTPYVPDGEPGQFKHPLTNGFVVGGTAGLFLTDSLAAIATYEYARATSRSGEITGVVDDIDGKISYHTALVGARMDRWLGPGMIVGELGVGIVFPFETELEYEYNEALAPLGITGEGRQINDYGVAYGGRAMFGFKLPITRELYVGNYLTLEAFQSNNNGRETRFENFVQDFTAEPPEATTAVIEYDSDGGPQPNTYPVSSARLQLVVGYQF